MIPLTYRKVNTFKELREYMAISVYFKCLYLDVGRGSFKAVRRTSPVQIELLLFRASALLIRS